MPTAPVVSMMGIEPAPEAPAPSRTPSLLQLIWLASPALPVGGFSYSEGLEASVEQGLVHDEASAAQWLSDQLHLNQARAEMAVLAPCISAWQRLDAERLRALSLWVWQTRESQEFRLQTEQMGRSLWLWLRDQNQASPAQLALCAELVPSWPIAMGLALSQVQAPLHDALLAYGFGWAENMVQAAIKSVPLGQTAGQRILARLSAELPMAVSKALQTSDGSRQAFSPMLAILSARHETQYSRLFRS